MPTGARPAFAKEAVARFLAQSWQEKELIIIDELNAPSFDTAPLAGATIIYRKGRGATLGDKRNFAVMLAKGEVIIHWDDDDLSEPDRIDHQVEQLTGFDLTAYNEMPFLNVETGERYEFRGAADYAIGTSLCYWKSTWEKRQFASRNYAEDWAFADGRKVNICPSGGRILARIHPENTVDKLAMIATDPRWKRIECSAV